MPSCPHDMDGWVHCPLQDCPHCPAFNRLNSSTHLSVSTIRLYTPRDISLMTSIDCTAVTHCPFLSHHTLLYRRLLSPHHFLLQHTSVSALWFNSNLPPLPDAFRRNCSNSSASFLPSSLFCRQVTAAVGEAAQQYRRVQNQKGDTMNSYLSAKEMASLHLSPALTAQQDYR